ncbi:2-dehydro-3-deoxygluconokinase [Virgibacillus phasianinus]|uniref:2-dehydro-3-deoxygluconokinase n=1 Tax=Virgibacillus phasianinus TaxID=2017483 RepID=A0A220TYB2_9BACI|nr:sugar kinase [Virgibacillus phasianinus]ASK60974.1 2-dehydro-3-deoxygluconokinase [Virgibacillus phasianinus]
MSKIVTLGELLLRLTPVRNQRLNQGGDLHAYYGGAEANVAMSLSNFNHEVFYLSVLPPNDLGDAAESHLKSGGVDTRWVFRGGERIGTYFYEKGLSLKQAKVIYDRKHSSVLELPKKDLDWDAVYKDVAVLHTSGITPALSGEMKEFTLLAMKEAKKRNVLVSFDFNYRGKLWSVEEANDTFLAILPLVDYCFAGYKDFIYLLGCDGPADFDEDVLEKHYHKFAEEYGITYFSCTNRTVFSSTANELEGYIFNNGALYKSNRFSFEIVDRIGGGDAFAAGVLHGILSDFESQEIVEFGVGSSVLKHMVYGDHNQFNAGEVKDFLANHGGDVSR